MTNFWDGRYSESDYVYGTEPNVYFKSKLDMLPPGSLLLPAEGEGRNAVYSASNGWQVKAFDSSSVGRMKALNLAESLNVKIDYEFTNDEDFYSTESYDAAAFIFSHFGNVRNNKTFPKLSGYIKPGGHIIFECFSINQIEFQQKHGSGGPSEIDMLFSTGDIHEIFPDFEILDLAQRTINLIEGKYHHGYASVIDFFGKKKPIQ